MMRLSRLQRCHVLGAGGRRFGDLDDFVIDEHTWTITGLVIRLESDAVVSLGFEKPFWRRARLTIPVTRAHEENGVLVLDLTMEQFSDLLDTDTIDAELT